MKSALNLLDSWMPTCDVRARYTVAIAASPSQVYEALLTTDFSRPRIVRALMGLRLIPGLFRSPRETWRRLSGPRAATRLSLRDLSHSDFVLLEQKPPHEIVLGITGRFWTLLPCVETIPSERFRDPLAGGLAQAAWNFEVSPTPTGSDLATETRIRCADRDTLCTFRRYWRVVAPGSGIIRQAILGQVRREAVGDSN
ncbi:MAG: hypothetical protein ABI613_09055 [Gemmatimonadota bacterium]